MNYATIKETAKEHGMPPSELLALSPGNDPFYVGSPGQMEKAKWFRKIYELMGEPHEIHVRRVHYWLVSQSPKYFKPRGEERKAELDRLKASGELETLRTQEQLKELEQILEVGDSISEHIYEEELNKVLYMNTKNDWGLISISAKYARYAGFVPVENIIDRRNPPAIIHSSNWEHENPEEVREGVDAEDIIEAIVDKFWCYNSCKTQSYMMEIWCEKSTMNDILEPICQEYGMNLVCGLGELSITSVHLLLNRISRANKPTRIFYISDFDPAGEGMPVSVSRKIEYLIQNRDINEDVKLMPIMLTPEQCDHYDLPRTPLKDSDLRKEGFEDRHGVGATELDALEALHPGELKEIIETRVLEYFDQEAWDEANNKNWDIRTKVREFLEDKISNVLETLDLSEFQDEEFTKSDLIDDDHMKWLYDSNLDYMDQLSKYKEHKS